MTSPTAARLFPLPSLAIATLGVALCCVPLFAQNRKPVPHLTRDVYPFLGVDWGGNTFVGAALPFGVVKVGPDIARTSGVSV